MLALAFAGPVQPIPSVEPDSFSDLYRRSKEVERDLKTLRADFVETTESDLLLEPVVARGSLVASVPMRIFLRYEEPERKILLLDGDEIRFFSLEREDDVTLAIGEIQKSVDKYFHQASEKELRNHFDIRISSDPERPGIQLIDMLARRKQIKKGLERLQIWVDGTTLHMVKMRMVFPGGTGSKTFELSDLQVNVPVSDDDFRIDREEATSSPRLRSRGDGLGPFRPDPVFPRGRAAY